MLKKCPLIRPSHFLYLTERSLYDSNLCPSLGVVCNLFHFSKIYSPNYSTSLGPSFLSYVGGGKPCECFFFPNAKTSLRFPLFRGIVTLYKQHLRLNMDFFFLVLGLFQGTLRSLVIVS